MDIFFRPTSTGEEPAKPDSRQASTFSIIFITDHDMSMCDYNDLNIEVFDPLQITSSGSWPIFFIVCGSDNNLLTSLF